MAAVALFVAATKLAGAAVALAVAANTVSFSRFRRRHLLPFVSPLHEHQSSPVLADFHHAQFSSSSFFFGLATAPAHAEDRLDDAWLHFASQQHPNRPSSSSSSSSSDDEEANPPAPQPADALMASASGDGGSHPARPRSPPGEPKEGQGVRPLKVAMEAMIRGFENLVQEAPTDQLPSSHHNVAAWHNVPRPQERLRFWSDPDIELNLAKDTGVTVFRMGIDWSRIMPKEPLHGLKDIVNFAALERYRWIIERVRSYGMKVMLTLFHHSLPSWAGDYGGWKLEKTVDYFLHFTRLVVDRVSDLVDYWVVFNEPHVFVMLTYCAGAWPGGHPDMLEVATSALPTGIYFQALRWMAIAHNKAYDYIHQESKIKKPVVGVAHHVSFTRPYGLFDVAAASLANSLTLFPYIDSISEKLDFIGINYYGQEVISGPGLKLVDNDEYSESGRGVYPDGLYRVLLMFHERYKHLDLPFVITENGVSDETDLIRRPYLIEHLLAIYAAMLKGVPVLGYLFWTISDNWEWADGYGPKFGLVAVDRANNMARKPRPSYHLFTKVVKTGQITKVDRMHAWNELQRAVIQKKTRAFYRAVDRNGRMYAGGLDEPIQRPFVQRDWRFGHYEIDGLKDPLSRFMRFILSPFVSKRSNKKACLLLEDEEETAPQLMTV
ncbi:Beta-glucosidase-like protein [Rhynchospora pubera]|uniref:Beta-glucosidase-like protein n=1 Tax=Rhynchospora pubera TaxID=906938 RepID=A0AAV8EGE9_9POAL|nr:Beta-glucosidase-like protein [Rhynchospora pubera]